MKSWSKCEALDYSDIAHFIEAACTVIQTIEMIDFGLLENGKQLKTEITEGAVAVICKGLTDILSIE